MAKLIEDVDEYIKATKAIDQFSRIHNTTRKDIELLINLKGTVGKENVDGFKRNIIVRFFSLIEGDLFILNNIDPYPSYGTKDDFKSKFKNTIKQIYTTWERFNVLETYQSTKLADLWKLRRIRDEIVHPKNLDSLDLSEIHLDFIESVFQDYLDFLNELVKDFFISADLKIVLAALEKIKNEKTNDAN